jgi:tRNA A37 threonylcarbamoyladenosine synthetase subunit TsaC/SUA5/YrdC
MTNRTTTNKKFEYVQVMEGTTSSPICAVTSSPLASSSSNPPTGTSPTAFERNRKDHKETKDIFIRTKNLCK